MEDVTENNNYLVIIKRWEGNGMSLDSEEDDEK